MSKWTDFLSSKLPAKPLQAFHCLGLGRLAIVMGSSFFICLERRKYIFVCVTIDKAVCFQMNSVSVISHQGGCVYHVCLCVLLGLETGFSQGWPFRGVLGEAPAPPAGLGSLTPVCVGCGPRGGGGVRCTHVCSACACICHAYVSRTVGFVHLGAQLDERGWEVRDTVNALLFWLGSRFAGLCYLIQRSEWMDKWMEAWKNE